MCRVCGRWLGSWGCASGLYRREILSERYKREVFGILIYCGTSRVAEVFQIVFSISPRFTQSPRRQWCNPGIFDRFTTEIPRSAPIHQRFHIKALLKTQATRFHTQSRYCRHTRYLIYTMSRRAPDPRAERAAQNTQTIKSLLKLEGNKTCADCKRNKRKVHVMASPI